MKGLLLMMVGVLAILVQAVVQEKNPSLSSLSFNHTPTLTPFPHSPQMIFLSSHNDAKFRGNHSKRQNTAKEEENLGSVNTPKEKDSNFQIRRSKKSMKERVYEKGYKVKKRLNISGGVGY
jgi:hypothetical protein